MLINVKFAGVRYWIFENSKGGRRGRRPRTKKTLAGANSQQGRDNMGGRRGRPTTDKLAGDISFCTALPYRNT